MTRHPDPRTSPDPGDHELYRAIVELSPYGVFVADGDTRFRYVNDAACRLSGYAREELLGMRIPDLLLDAEAARDLPRFRQLVREGRYAGDVAVRLAGGRAGWWSVEGTRVGDDIFVGLVTDVTESRRLAAELERERQRLARAQQVAGVGWYEIDFARNAVRGSRQAARIYGVADEEDLTYTTVKSVPLPEERPRLDAALQDLVAGRAPYDIQFNIRRVADGAVRRVHSLAEYDPVHRTMFGVIMDITELTTTLSALEQREAQLTAIFDSARDLMFLKDRDLRYTRINRAALEFLGRRPDEVVGRTDGDIFPPAYLDEIRAIDRRVLAGEDDQTRVVREMNGREYILETVKVPVREPGGDVVGLCGVSRDITETRRLEDQLRQAQKMEAIGRLAGGVAHDFNNLLTPILGYTNLLRATLPADSPAQGDLEAIERAGLRARDLTANLLAFGRKQVLDKRVMSLNSVIADAQSMLHRLLRENIQIHLDLQDDLGVVKADVSQLQNVLINLAVNAADAMPGGGSLTIETQNVMLAADDARDHPDAGAGPHVLLAVSDDGCGMDAATRERIFEPFFTTKPVDEGTGLGLATVHGIVRQHSGSIEVSSEPGHGTTFKIYLPRVVTTPETKPEPRPPQALRGSERVLVVEDDESVRRLAAAVLTAYGYEVTAVALPSAAVELAAGSGPAYDLLLSDVVMPGMNGAQLHGLLRETWPELPALFMSGYTSNVIAHHGVLPEGLQFIQKPFVPLELARRVREILDE